MAELVLDRRFPEADVTIPAGMMRRRFQQEVSFYTPSIPLLLDQLVKTLADKVASAQRDKGLMPLTMRIYRSFEWTPIPAYRWDIDMEFGGPIEPSVQKLVLPLVVEGLILGVFTAAEFISILKGLFVLLVIVGIGQLLVKPVVEKAPEIGAAIEQAAEAIGEGIFVASLGIGLALLAYGYFLRLREGKALS